MKKTAYLLLTFGMILIFGASCTKSSSTNSTNGSANYVKIKQDNNWISFSITGGEYGSDLIDTSKKILVIAGDENTGSMKNFRLSLLREGSKITTGTYNTEDVSSTTIQMSYSTDWSTNKFKNYTISASSTATSKYIVKITNITNTEIEGSFTGNFLYDSFNSEAANITEGQFKVKRIR